MIARLLDVAASHAKRNKRPKGKMVMNCGVKKFVFSKNLPMTHSQQSSAGLFCNAFEELSVEVLIRRPECIQDDWIRQSLFLIFSLQGLYLMGCRGLRSHVGR